MLFVGGVWRAIVPSSVESLALSLGAYVVRHEVTRDGETVTELTVDKILDLKEVWPRGRVKEGHKKVPDIRYLVRWVGYNEDTREPAANLLPGSSVLLLIIPSANPLWEDTWPVLDTILLCAVLFERNNWRAVVASSEGLVLSLGTVWRCYW